MSPPLARSKSAGSRNDRHAHPADRKAAAARGEPAHDAVGCGQPESRAAGEHDRVDALDGVAGAEQVRLAGRRRAAGDMHRRDAGCIRQEHGDAGFRRRVGGMADPKAGEAGHAKRLGKSPSRPNDDQVERHDVVQDARKDQDDDAGDEGDERLEVGGGEGELHCVSPSEARARVGECVRGSGRNAHRRPTGCEPTQMKRPAPKGGPRIFSRAKTITSAT